MDRRRESIEQASIYTPIKVLNPTLYGWKVKARVLDQPVLTPYTNRRTNAPGNVLNVRIVDIDGSIISCRFWGTGAVAANTQLQKGKSYIFTGARIVASNKRFNAGSPHNYELSYDNLDDHMITETEDIGEVSLENMYTLSTIRSIETSTKTYPYTTNLLGVVLSTTGQRTVNTRNGEQLTVATVRIGDATLYSIDVSFWGNRSSIEFTPGSVIGLTTIQIRDNNFGIVGNDTRSTEILENLKTPTALELEAWYKNEGMHSSFIWLSQSNNTRPQHNTTAMSISEFVTEAQHVTNETGLFANVTAYVTAVHYTSLNSSSNDLTAVYNACNKCNKKMTDAVSCGFCGATQASPKLSATVVLADHSGSHFHVRAFNDSLELMLQKTAAEIHELKEDPVALSYLFTHVVPWNEYKFTLRARRELFNDAYRTSYSITSVSPVNHAIKANEVSTQLVNLHPNIFNIAEKRSNASIALSSNAKMSKTSIQC